MIKISLLKLKQHMLVCVINLISSVFLFFYATFCCHFQFYCTVRRQRSNIFFFALQLSSTKSVDGQVTLVHFLEDIIETKYPEITGFENELTHVEQAARGKSTPPRL